MLLEKVRIVLSDALPHGSAILPSSWRSVLTPEVLSAQHEITIRFGSAVRTLRISFGDGDELQLPSNSVWPGFLHAHAIHAKVENGQLWLGPILTIYCLILSSSLNPVMERSYKDLCELGREMGVIMTLAKPGDFDWKKKEVRVYHWLHNEWLRFLCPLPDMVSQRHTSMPPPHRETMLFDREQFFTKLPFTPFNQARGEKWEIHSLLNNDASTRKYLPATELLTSEPQIREMVFRHGDVFIKPIMGNRGLGIIRIRQKESWVEIKATNSVELLTGKSWEQYVQEELLTRRHLVQQAIPVTKTPEGAPMDFRWLLQRGLEDRWTVVARIARIGVPNAITTNNAESPDAYTVDATEALQKTGKSSEWISTALANVDEASMAIADVMRREHGRIAEVGFDFGITETGDAYMIEANPRPGKRIVYNVSPESYMHSLRLNLEFALRETGFALSEEVESN